MTANQARRGSVIQIFDTGEGLTTPAGITGSISTETVKTHLPVAITIGGVDAPVLLHGSAPYEISGLLQVHAMVPQMPPRDLLPDHLDCGLGIEF